MASEVDICNLALANLGDEATVAALSPADGSVQAEHCARFYPIARDALLSMHSWHFATKRVALALLVTTELPVSWTYAYQMPSKSIKPLSVLASTATDDSDTELFIVETLQDGTKVIFTNIDTATLRYIEGVTDTTKFSPLFIVALARLLSSYLAGPIIKGSEGAKMSQAHFQSFYKIELPQATAADSQGRKMNLYKDFIPDSLGARA